MHRHWEVLRQASAHPVVRAVGVALLQLAAERLADSGSRAPAASVSQGSCVCGPRADGFVSGAYQ